MKRIVCKYNLLVELIQNQLVNKSMMIFTDDDENIVGQSAEVVKWSFLWKRCSEKLCKIHRKRPVLESLFNKVVGLRPPSLLKLILQHRSFSVHFAKFWRKSCFYRTPPVASS